MQLLFTSDLHGSNSCFQKFIVEARAREVDFAVIGGDVTGKKLTYIVRTSGNTYETEFLGRKHTVAHGEQLVELERDIANTGSYTLRIEQDQRHLMVADERRKALVYAELAKFRLRSWLWWAKEEFAETKTQLVWINGNDDILATDDVIEQSAVARNPELSPFTSLGYAFIGESGANETPWRCPRDMNENVLRRRMQHRIATSGIEDFTKAIFVCHAPPKASGLDDASILQLEGADVPVVRITAGQVETNQVGSQAVRDIIEEYQPLVSLHGHIHESPGFAKIGRTLCCNPGSDYGSGILRAIYLVIEGDKVIDKQIVTV